MSPHHDLALLAHWRRLLEQLRVDAGSPLARKMGRTVVRAWARWPRRYHAHPHLLACMNACLDIPPTQADDPGAIAMALWYHDAVYWPWSNANEARSAEWARQDALALGLDPRFADTVHALVMATAHGGGGVPRGDARWVVDIDLGVLGQAPATYDRYAADVRREYFWVPEAKWRAGRAAVLRHFLGLPALYSTPVFRRQYEAAARANLARELAALAA